MAKKPGEQSAKAARRPFGERSTNVTTPVVSKPRIAPVTPKIDPVSFEIIDVENNPCFYICSYQDPKGTTRFGLVWFVCSVNFFFWQISMTISPISFSERQIVLRSCGTFWRMRTINIWKWIIVAKPKKCQCATSRTAATICSNRTCSGSILNWTKWKCLCLVLIFSFFYSSF